MRYVICVAITEDNEVVLIKKKRPAWQEGLFNFPGGKIEEGEHSYDACNREFFEETGIDFSAISSSEKYAGYKLYWTDCGTITGRDYTVHIWYSRNNVFKNVVTLTDEEVFIIKISDLQNMRNKLVDNVLIIIEGCLATENSELYMQLDYTNFKYT